MNDLLSNIKSFVATAFVAFDHYADLYVIEFNAQRVTATQVDMKQFIGVRGFNYFSCIPITIKCSYLLS